MHNCTWKAAAMTSKIALLKQRCVICKTR